STPGLTGDAVCACADLQNGLTDCPHAQAPVVELVDAPDSKSGTERCVGSSPTGGTIILRSRPRMGSAGGGERSPTPGRALWFDKAPHCRTIIFRLRLSSTH